MLRAKAVRARAEGIPLGDRLLADPDRTGRLAAAGGGLASWGASTRLGRVVMEKVLGIHRDAAMPMFAGRTFQGWARRHRSPNAAKRIVYFHGCGANYYEPRLGEMTVAVLTHNGFGVDVPKQDCCGLPLQSNGIFDTARGYTRRLARHLRRAASGDTVIVGTSTSCTLMLKREAKEILGLAGEPDLEYVSSRTYDIVEFLLQLHARGELNTDFAPVDMTVTYHAPCQQQGHGVGKPALDLMELVPGLRVVENDASCCGVAGTYGLKKEKYAISMDVGSTLFGQIERAAPDLAVCDSETCRWHIEKATGVKSVHPVEILHRAYGLS